MFLFCKFISSFGQEIKKNISQLNPPAAMTLVIIILFNCHCPFNNRKGQKKKKTCFKKITKMSLVHPKKLKILTFH